jgi:phosphoribosyl 1,2-cyclic phosphate phosphodiesterase
LKPAQSYLTHLCHDLPHAETNDALPPGVELAYDGLQFEIEIAPSSVAAAPEARWT